MIHEKCTSPEVFGFGLLLPKEIYPYIQNYQAPLSKYVNWFVKESYQYPGSNSMVAHVTLKYLGYHKEHSNEEISKLIPELIKISRKHLPLRIKVKGIEIGTKYSNIGVLLKFKPSKEIKSFHNELIKELGNKIDIFKEMDGDNFEPHIAIATAEKTETNLKELRKIAKDSQKDLELELELSEPYIFMKDKGPVALKEHKLK